MAILITGGSGFVGGHLARLLCQEGEKVRLLLRPSSNLSQLQGLDYEPAPGDLRSYDSLLAACQGIDLVYHCAADYRLWVKDPQELYDSNVEGTRHLLEAARQAGVKRVVVTSSVAAVGIPAGGGVGDEDTPVSLEDMVGHYKRSKFLGERVAMEAAQQGQDVVVVNPSTPIGPGDLKPTDTGQIITRFLRGGMPAYLNTGLNLVDVEDVCRGHILAAQKGARGRRYILGGYDMSLQQILLELADISGLAAPKVQLPWWVAYVVGWADTWISTHILKRPPSVPLDGVKMARKIMYFSWKRAQRELGYEPRPVRRALEGAVRWFVDYGYAPETPLVKRGPSSNGK